MIEQQGARPTFEEMFSSEQISTRVKEIAREITEDYRGKNLLIVGILKGSFVFVADLTREIELDDLEIDFMAVSSYDGTTSSREPKIIKDLGAPIKDRHVLIVEDIVDTGFSFQTLLEMLEARNPASLKTCSLLSKPDRRKVEVPIDYLGFEIKDKWIEGYGLDTDQMGRGRSNIVIRREN